LSFDQALEIISGRRVQRGPAFVLTFDDGFENNYTIAAPILLRLNVPAIFYITTDYIEKNMMSWIDLIEYAAEHSRIFRWG
jgi:peptidoglycan/xylan/chitin deacetylase (PgdA/CDA1 family)